MKLADIKYTTEGAKSKLSNTLKEILTEDAVIFCIGSDRSIADSLAPMVGTRLSESGFKNPIYGTLENPIHALNIHESINNIKNNHPGASIIAIDACIGSKSTLGNITIRNTSVKPGRGVGKRLPEIGDYSICGVVTDSVGNFNNVRLSFVLELSGFIASALVNIEN